MVECGGTEEGKGKEWEREAMGGRRKRRRKKSPLK